MIELGPGIAAVLGALVGGLGTFGASWLAGWYERRGARDERADLRSETVRSSQLEANHQLIAASASLVAICERIDGETAGGNEPTAQSVQQFEKVYAQVTDAAARAMLVGPEADLARVVLEEAGKVAGRIWYDWSVPSTRRFQDASLSFSVRVSEVLTL